MKSIPKNLFTLCSALLVCTLLLSSCQDMAAETTAAGTTASAPASTTTASVTTTVPSTTEPDAPSTEPETGDAPVTGEVAKDCFAIFAEGLAEVGKSITVSRELTAEELATVEAFVVSEDVRAVLSAAWYEPFYRPEDVHLYEILYADPTNVISEEEAVLLKGDPQWVSDWSRMTTDEIKSMAKQYLGIEVTQAMLDAMLEEQVYIEGEVTDDGAVYLAEYDAYYRHHTDAGGMYPSDITGWLTADGKLLLHMISLGGDEDHVLALLCPTQDGYHIEAVQWADEESVTDAPVTGEVAKDCYAIFAEGLAEVGKSVTVSRELTAEELDSVKAFASLPDVRLVYGAAYKSFYLPEDISLYELLYASNIQTEVPDNPYQNDGSMMTVARIREVVRNYLGIEVTQDMLDQLVADGAEYHPDTDAYGFAHTDAGGFYPAEEMHGYLTADGKLVVHMQAIGDKDHVLALLCPIQDGYLIEAARWIDRTLATDCEVVPN
ncbi:MAG: hypothetical protein IJX47_05080 [Clostridia bacterium]|nr:hypothetical protein [Clostridia bacterium]